MCVRLSAALVRGVIRAGRPHPLCQQTVKPYSNSLLATIWSRRCKKNISRPMPARLSVRWSLALWGNAPVKWGEANRHAAEQLLSDPSSYTWHRREPTFVFPLPRASVWSKREPGQRWGPETQVNLHNNVSGGVTGQSVHVGLCVTASL